VLFVDAAHQCSSGWQDLIDEDEDSLLWRELYTLANDVNELADSEISRNEILLLVDCRNVGLLDLFADDGNAIRVLGTNLSYCQANRDTNENCNITYSLRFCLTLLKLVLLRNQHEY
jgi:hypothetical protein